MEELACLRGRPRAEQHNRDNKNNNSHSYVCYNYSLSLCTSRHKRQQIPLSVLFDALLQLCWKDPREGFVNIFNNNIPSPDRSSSSHRSPFIHCCFDLQKIFQITCHRISGWLLCAACTSWHRNLPRRNSEGKRNACLSHLSFSLPPWGVNPKQQPHKSVCLLLVV